MGPRAPPPPPHACPLGRRGRGIDQALGVISDAVAHGDLLPPHQRDEARAQPVSVMCGSPKGGRVGESGKPKVRWGVLTAAGEGPGTVSWGVFGVGASSRALGRR